MVIRTLLRKLAMYIHAGSKLRITGFAESCLRAIFCEWLEHAFALASASHCFVILVTCVDYIPQLHALRLRDYRLCICLVRESVLNAVCHTPS